jgi:hypothetical protein
VNELTVYPTIFAVNSHHDAQGSWVSANDVEGMAVEANQSGVEITMGCQHEAYVVDLSKEEARRFARWLLNTVGDI